MAGLSLQTVNAKAFSVLATATQLKLPAWGASNLVQSCILQNTSAVTIEVGGSDIAIGQGIQVYAGQSFPMDIASGGWWAISSSGTASVRLLEAS
jgi:hypothetical protein